MVQRRSGNGSALYGKERCRCSSRLTWCFVVGELTCSRALIWWFGVWCLVFLWPAGSRFTKASGRLAGMRGPATRLKRDVRPVLGVMRDGGTGGVFVYVMRGSVCYSENIVWRRRCMSEKQRRPNSTVSQQKSPPPDSPATFKGRCPAAAAGAAFASASAAGCSQ